MINDKYYWESFYKQHPINKDPSSFARYVFENYLETNKILLELGCGNGRDAIYFASQGLNVSAIDLAEKEIEFLQQLNIENAIFNAGSFTDLKDYNGFDFIYSRFTFHSIDEESEDQVLSQLKNTLKKDGLFLLEARSSKDEKLDKVFGTSHFRRYLDFNKTIAKIESKGFEIIESLESQGLAKYKQEDPYVLRIVARSRG